MAARLHAVTGWLAVFVSRTWLWAPVATSLTFSGISAAAAAADDSTVETNIKRDA
jgi:hypothetical protein